MKKPRLQKTSRTGRTLKHPKPLTKPITVAAAINTLPASAFRQVTVKQGSQGPIVYEYAELTVWFSEESLPATEPESLLVRRSLGQQPELKYSSHDRIAGVWNEPGFR